MLAKNVQFLYHFNASIVLFSMQFYQKNIFKNQHIKVNKIKISINIIKLKNLTSDKSVWQTHLAYIIIIIMYFLFLLNVFLFYKCNSHHRESNKDLISMYIVFFIMVG